MKRKLLFFCLMIIMLMPVMEIRATSILDNISSEQPPKSTKYQCEGSRYGIYLQFSKLLLGDFDFDGIYYYDEEEHNYGMELQVYSLQNKKTYTFDMREDDCSFKQTKSKYYCIMYADISEVGNQGLVYKYRYYALDENSNKIYSKYSKQTVMIPYATGMRYQIAKKGNTKVYWQKIKGAKSYTVYICNMYGKNKKKLTTTKKNYTNINTSKFKKNKCYYFYVKVNGVKYKKKRYNSGKFDVIDYCELIYVVQ